MLEEPPPPAPPPPEGRTWRRRGACWSATEARAAAGAGLTQDLTTPFTLVGGLDDGDERTLPRRAVPRDGRGRSQRGPTLLVRLRHPAPGGHGSRAHRGAGGRPGAGAPHTQPEPRPAPGRRPQPGRGQAG